MGLKAVVLKALRWPRFRFNLANVYNVLVTNRKEKLFHFNFLHNKTELQKLKLFTDLKKKASFGCRVYQENKSHDGSCLADATSDLYRA